MASRARSRVYSFAKRFVLLILLLLGGALALLGGYGVFLSGSLALPKSDEHPPLLIYGAPLLLQRFRLAPAPGQTEPRLEIGMSVRPVGGLHMTLTPRQASA